MRWWDSNLGQGLLQTKTLSLIVIYIYPAFSTNIVPNFSTAWGPMTPWASPVSIPSSPASAWGHPTTFASPVSIPASLTTRLSVPDVIPIPHCMFLLNRRLLLSSRKISSKVALSYVSSSSWHHHASLLRPPSS